MPSTQQPSPYRALLLTDGHAGNLRQAAALARALGVDAGAPPLAPRTPWRWFAPRCLPGSGHAFGEAFADLLHDATPPLAIGCGRQGALATRLLRQRGAMAVQILDPRLDPRLWDLVVAPEHDGLRGANVIPLLGSLNPVDEAWLAEGAAAFPQLLALPRPRVLVLAGGPTRHAPWSLDVLQASLRGLRPALAERGGSLLASSSRRSPGGTTAALEQAASGLPGLVWNGQEAGNPYPGLLAAADLVLCTPDSVNMLSEACATAAQVRVLGPGIARGRIARYLGALQERGRIAAWRGLDGYAPATPLRETARVAARVREQLGLDATPGV